MILQTHILNGDGLLQQMGEIINGEKIVSRECLVEGTVQGDSLAEFFENRNTYLQKTYDVSGSEYLEVTRQEFEKIKTIPDNSEIILWFEDDLFCQCNLWFVCHLLVEWKINRTIFLVRPGKGNEYSFGTMPKQELLVSLENRVEIIRTDLLKIQKLWHAYQENNTSEMISQAQSLHQQFPFMGPAVYAHIANKLRIPEKSIKQIMQDLKNKEFEPVFKEFCKREAIYGFGDVQVKRMFDKIIEKQNEQ